MAVHYEVQHVWAMIQIRKRLVMQKILCDIRRAISDFPTELSKVDVVYYLRAKYPRNRLDVHIVSCNSAWGSRHPLYGLTSEIQH